VRVVMSILEYHPITGGAQSQLASVAPRIAAGGVEIEVWTRAVRGLPRFEWIAGVPVFRLGRPGPAASASFAAESAARLALAPPDVVHAFSLFSPAAVALFARRVLGIPALVKVLRGGMLGDAERLRRKRFGRWRAAALARGIDRFAVISSEIDAELAALGVPPERRCFVPNGVDAERFQPLPELARAELRARLGVGDAPLVVYAGRLVPEKRVGDLLVAWVRVREAHPAAQLLVLGGGECAAELHLRTPPGVRFLGDVGDIAPYLRVADAFALPSGTEGLSNALLEAMAAGLPVVATAVGGAVDLVESGENGQLVAPGDTAALARALISLLAGRSRARRIGANARQRVTSGYSLNTVAERLLHLYRDLAAAPRTRPTTALAATRH
jgi:glycosyltransferase involved in cell wall biosynthesis